MIKLCTHMHSEVHDCDLVLHTDGTFTLWSLVEERRWRTWRRRRKEPPTPYLQVYSPSSLHLIPFSPSLSFCLVAVSCCRSASLIRKEQKEDK